MKKESISVEQLIVKKKKKFASKTCKLKDILHNVALDILIQNYAIHRSMCVCACVCGYTPFSISLSACLPACLPVNLICDLEE